MKTPKPKVPKVPQPGHYNRPTMKFKGLPAYNAPGVGRIGKQMPSPKKLGRPKK